MFRYYNDLFWNINSISPFYTYSLPCAFSKLSFLLFFTPECPEWRLFTGFMAFLGIPIDCSSLRMNCSDLNIFQNCDQAFLFPSFPPFTTKWAEGDQFKAKHGNHLWHFSAPFPSKIHLRCKEVEEENLEHTQRSYPLQPLDCNRSRREKQTCKPQTCCT